MSLSNKLRVVFLAAALVGIVGVTAAQAVPSSTVTTAAPRHAGDIELRFFTYADPQGTHGVPCSVTTTITQADIDASITAEQKAAKIEAAINASNCGVTVVRTGSVLTITAPPNGVKVTRALDQTGEILLVDNDGTGLPVEYRTRARLYGNTTTNGIARIGENGVTSQIATSTALTLEDIYAGWVAGFGVGGYDEHGLVLPVRQGEIHGFEFEVTDPGLSIEVSQEMVNPIPTVSEWGMIIMTLLLLTAGTIVLGRRRQVAVA